jgi:hypothetical protein
METKKYWKNVIRGPFYIGGEPGTTGVSISAHNNEYGNGTTLGYHCINDYYEAPITHSHEFHELICFLGGNPENIDDLGAEISICLGDELEEHIIKSATIISIPPGLKHCPLKVIKYTKPFIFLEISTTKGYSQSTEASAQQPEKPAKKSKKL